MPEDSQSDAYNRSTGRQPGKGSGALRLQYPRAPSLTTQVRDLWQGPCSEGSQGIMYMSLRKLHQGRAYPLPFTATIQPFVIDKGLYLPCRRTQKGSEINRIHYIDSTLQFTFTFSRNVFITVSIFCEWASFPKLASSFRASGRKRG